MKKNENSIRNKGILSLVLIILLFVLVRFALLYIGAKLGETRENELIQLKMSALTDIVSDANANSTAAAERVSGRLTAETRLMTGMLKEFCSEGSYDGPRTLPGGFVAELRGSGDLEQDADNVIFLHRPSSEQDKYVHPADRALFPALKENGLQYIAIHVAKQRQGPIGTVATIFNPGRMLYTMIQRQPPRPQQPEPEDDEDSDE